MNGLTQYMGYLESLPESTVANAPTMAEYSRKAPTETAILPRMSHTVYRHPDGFTLAFNDNVLTATDDNDNIVCIPIGPMGLIALGELLTAIGKNREFHGC